MAAKSRLDGRGRYELLVPRFGARASHGSFGPIAPLFRGARFDWLIVQDRAYRPRYGCPGPDSGGYDQFQSQAILRTERTGLDPGEGAVTGNNAPAVKPPRSESSSLSPSIVLVAGNADGAAFQPESSGNDSTVTFNGPPLEQWHPGENDGLPVQDGPYETWAPEQFMSWTPAEGCGFLEGHSLERGQLTSFVGIGGIGKSRLTLRLGIDQILGRTWCGLRTKGPPARFLYLCTENGRRRWGDDLRKMTAGLSPEQRLLIDKHISILVIGGGETPSICLGDENARRRLQATLILKIPDVVVFDPFADMVAGDENKTNDMMETLRQLQFLMRSAPNAAVLLVHHARTGTQNMVQAGDNFSSGNVGRGSKALYSKVRCEIQVHAASRDDSERLVVICGKSNDAPKFAPREVVMNPATFDYDLKEGFDIDAWRADVNGTRKETVLSLSDVYKVVKSLAPSLDDEVFMKEIMAKLEGASVSQKTVRRRIKEGINAGYLRPGKKKGSCGLGSKPLPRL
jgi:hypothetical protein